MESQLNQSLLLGIYFLELCSPNMIFYPVILLLYDRVYADVPICVHGRINTFSFPRNPSTEIALVLLGKEAKGSPGKKLFIYPNVQRIG